MPQIKQAIKRVRTQNASRAQNISQKNDMRTTVKKFREAAAAGADNAQDLYKDATRALDMAATKHLIHKNTAGRSKSRLHALLKK